MPTTDLDPIDQLVLHVVRQTVRRLWLLTVAAFDLLDGVRMGLLSRHVDDRAADTPPPPE